MPKSDRRVFVDLFAGCGGLSLGLENAGFEPIFVNELSPDAMNTYLANRDEHYPDLRQKYNSRDIKDLVKDDRLDDLVSGFKRDYGIKQNEIDLVVGGPPCQGYSGIGHRRSYSVDKKQLPSNHLYQDYAYVIHKLRPKIFLFENVRGLLNSRWTKGGHKGEIWEDVYGTLAGIPGYKVNYQLVFAKDYGVPQNRPRVLAVGIREDVDVVENPTLPASGFLPCPTQGYPNIEDLFSDLVDKDYEPGGKTTKYPSPATNEVQRALRTDPRSKKVRGKSSPVTDHEYSQHSAPIVEKFTFMIANNGKIPESMQTKKFAQRVLPPTWGDKGPTITATSLPDDYVHYKQPRSLTVREWARLQMFPDWYQFHGKRTTGGTRRAGNPREGIHFREVPKYTQIGNAVPVKLAEEVGLHFKEILS